ncbi:phage tail spike protein [Terrihalobacillus insolitus]|uniref:phage tail spike protein n=1 Tax=Terrihalobacillus insolitus TaxID=2950438 RepID=UPI00234232D4|nr:phage tail spike protein [Terrihalobacillus insolitus]MDC3413955.1 phage tail protein [Terrihalobacillus insolitus]
MSTTKALFTNSEDFRQIGWDSFPVNPYLYHDGDSWAIDNSGKNSFGWVGTAPTSTDFVDDKKGKGVKLGKVRQMRWLNVGFPASNKYMISLWIKPTTNDIAANWSIIATNRGDGWANKGLHIAMYYGQLNVRVYGTATTSLYSDGTNGQANFTFQADQWYHVCLIYDQTASYKVKTYVNNQLICYTSSDADPTAGFPNSFTVGDMIGSNLPFDGEVDEVIVCHGENVWTIADVETYYNGVLNHDFLDYWTTSGSLQLPKDSTGAYPTTLHTWASPIVDLGEKGFDAYGKLHAVGQIPSESTTLTFYTRTSDDSITWEEWQQVGQDGVIYSADKRYIQVKVDFQTTYAAQTPILEEIQIIDIPKEKRLILSAQPLNLYRDLDTGLDSLGELKNAYDIIIEEEVNGEDTLTFKLPINDPKRKVIGDEPVEMLAVIGDRYYVVKEVKDKRDNDGKLYTEFKGESLWYELRDYYVEAIEVVEVTAYTALTTILSNIFYEVGDPQCDWTIGKVEITKKRTLRSEWNNVLALIREVQNTWGGEIQFDNKNKQIHLLNRIGKNSGVRFYYNKNLKTIERQIDTYDLITRIYPTGKGDLDITTVNGGVKYLENRTWVDRLNLRKKIIPYRWKDERYTIPQNLKEDAQKMLDEMSKPQIRYAMSVHDLSALSGHEHESYELGDDVMVVDKDLFGEEVPSRIVRRKWDVRRPENTEIELSQPQKTLADIQKRALDDSLQTLVSSDPLSTTDAQQMTVFNQLLNSRADEGINGDWVQEGTGFGIENVGFSGNWSFKVTPNYNEINRITQTVEGVSHRSTYTISAAVATEGQITRGGSPDAFVGIKVIVHYQDGGEPDVHYLKVPDVTDTGGA